MKQKSSFFKALGIMLLSVLFATQANAQNLTVTGTVTDNLGPVIGASIQVEGTSNGCITDIDGNYTLPNVPANATLVFSYIGYQTQKIAVGGKTKIDVKLAEESCAEFIKFPRSPKCRMAEACGQQKELSFLSSQKFQESESWI